MVFPQIPVPSSVSAPEIIDPVLTFAVDQGYVLRRSKTSRPRRRYTMEWLGRTITDLRIILDYVQDHRFGALPFDWLHPTAFDAATINNTTPVILTYTHGLVTGQWVYVGGFAPTPLVGAHQVTRLSYAEVALNGTSASGTGTAAVYTYLPSAVTVHAQDTWASPTKLLGPDQAASALYGTRGGIFSWSVIVEEQF